MSSYNEFDLVRQAMKLGTFDYLFKPAMLPPDIIEVVKRRCRNSGKRAAAGSRNLTERGFPETENSFFGIS